MTFIFIYVTVLWFLFIVLIIVIYRRVKLVECTYLRLRDILHSSADTFLYINQSGEIIASNKSFETLFGYNREETKKEMNFLKLISKGKQRKLMEIITSKDPMQKLSKLNVPFESIGIRKDGTRIPIEISISSYMHRKESEFFIIIRDITSRKETELQQKKEHKKLTHLATHDKLTGIANRTLLHEHMEQSIALAKRKHTKIGVIFIDMDDFKNINDRFGHDIGDQILKETAKRLKKCTRDSDIVGRLGGDEFMIILNEIQSPKDAAKFTKRLIQHVTKPVKIEDQKIEITVSIGISIFPTDGLKSDNLIAYADTAMYKAKSQGKNGYRIVSNKDTHDQFTKHIPKKGARLLKKVIDDNGYIIDKHPYRVAELMRDMSEKLGLDGDEIVHAELLGLLHDIGKLSIPIHIINKKTHLSDRERAKIKEHVENGAKFIVTGVDDLKYLEKPILAHHEWWNGDGYPNRLKGNDIPLLARILAIVDAYDVMINDRAYKKSISHMKAIKKIKKMGGTQFDPKLVKVFVKMMG